MSFETGVHFSKIEKEIVFNFDKFKMKKEIVFNFEMKEEAPTRSHPKNLEVFGDFFPRTSLKKRPSIIWRAERS